MNSNDRCVIRAYRGRSPAGTRLNGIYEIDELIAAGGMGEIYKAHAIQTGDAVAIKMIRPDMAENEAALALFRKEASALHNLHHEAIVRYYRVHRRSGAAAALSGDGVRRRAARCRTCCAGARWPSKRWCG